MPKWLPSTCRFNESMTKREISVTIASDPKRFRILAQTPQRRVLQAVLSPNHHGSRALRLLLGALSEGQPEPISVVLCADESGTGTLSETFGALAAVGGARWRLGLAVVRGADRYGADWTHAFDDLSELHHEGGFRS